MFIVSNYRYSTYPLPFTWEIIKTKQKLALVIQTI